MASGDGQGRPKKCVCCVNGTQFWCTEPVTVWQHAETLLNSTISGTAETVENLSDRVSLHDCSRVGLSRAFCAWGAHLNGFGSISGHRKSIHSHRINSEKRMGFAVQHLTISAHLGRPWEDIQDRSEWRWSLTHNKSKMHPRLWCNWTGEDDRT